MFAWWGRASSSRRPSPKSRSTPWSHNQVALDAEFAPNYIPGEGGLLALLQLAAGPSVFVVFLNRINDSAALAKLWGVLADPDKLKLGQSFKNDLRNVMGQLAIPELSLQNYIDIADLYVDLTGSKSPALDKICLEMFRDLIRKTAFQVRAMLGLGRLPVAQGPAALRGHGQPDSGPDLRAAEAAVPV